MKNFFKTIVASFYSSQLYQKAKDESAKFGIRFIIKLAVFLGLIFGIIGLIIFLSFSTALNKLAINFIDKSYPNELIMTVKDGTLTSNTPEPVFVPTPVTQENEKLPQNIVALVPNEKAEASILSKYDTMSAVTSNGIIYLKNATGLKQIEIYPYGKTDKVLTKNFILEKSVHLLKVIATVAAIGIIPMLILIFLMISFGNMLSLFVVALLIYLVMRLKKLKISYKQAYRMGLYALGPLLILQILTCSFHFIGILFAIAVVLAIILIATHSWKGEEVKTDETETPPNL